MKRAVKEATNIDSIPKSRTFHRCITYSRGPSVQISLHSDQIMPETHTHIGFTCFLGFIQQAKWFSNVQTVFFYPLTPTLHFNLPLTQHFLHFLIFKKKFCMIYKLVPHGDQKNVRAITIFVGTFCTRNVEYT